MQDLMTSKIGIFRRGEDMESAVAELEDLLKKTYKVSVKDKAGNNPELVYAYRTRKMLKVALAIACGAAARKESRGAHFREDFPVRNDAEWLCRTIATWKNENDTLPTLSYEKLDISKMELPRVGVVTVLRTTSITPKPRSVRPKSTPSVPRWKLKVQTALLFRMRSCRSTTCCRSACRVRTNASMNPSLNY